MSRLRRRRAGYSLTELVIAIALSSLVLLGVVSISAQMLRFQVEGMKKGTVTGWFIVSLMRMNKEIEDANVLVYPTTASGGADSLVGCANWSRMMNGKIDVYNAASPVKVFYYCYDTTALQLRRYVSEDPALTCPAGVPGYATGACGGGSWEESEVIATNVYRNGGAAIFTRANDAGGVHIRYIVGDPTPTTNMPIPQSIPYDSKIGMNKQYNNTLD